MFLLKPDGSLADRRAATAISLRQFLFTQGFAWLITARDDVVLQRMVDALAECAICAFGPSDLLGSHICDAVRRCKLLLGLHHYRFRFHGFLCQTGRRL